MTYQSYDLSRYIDGDLSQSNSITVSDHDTLNCAHMLVAGFNTMSRNFMGDFVLGVVNTKSGSVQYDGKIEKFDRSEPAKPGVYKQSFKLETSADTDTIVTLFGEAGDRIVYPGKLSFVKDDEASEELHKLGAAHIARPVLEAAYAELQAVKEVLFNAGVETIPADAGVTDLRALLRARDAEISELVQALANWAVEVEELRKRDEHERYARQNMEAQHARSNEAARAEMIEYVKGAYAKLGRLDAAGERDDLQGRMRGMLDVLAKFLAVTGEADHDERHAVARRLCGIPEGAWV